MRRFASLVSLSSFFFFLAGRGDRKRERERERERERGREMSALSLKQKEKAAVVAAARAHQAARQPKNAWIKAHLEGNRNWKVSSKVSVVN